MSREDLRALAEHRLKLLKKRLCRDPDLFGKYSSVIDDYLYKGYCEKVPDSSLSRADDKVWYLPDHPVLHPAKPNKTRVGGAVHKKSTWSRKGRHV